MTDHLAPMNTSASRSYICSRTPASPKFQFAHTLHQHQHLKGKAQGLRGLTHPSKAGCDFLSILAQAHIWAGLPWKARFVHHCASSCFSSRNATYPRPAQNRTSSQAPTPTSPPSIIQILHKICWAGGIESTKALWDWSIISATDINCLKLLLDATDHRQDFQTEVKQAWNSFKEAARDKVHPVRGCRHLPSLKPMC